MVQLITLTEAKAAYDNAVENKLQARALNKAAKEKALSAERQQNTFRGDASNSLTGAKQVLSSKTKDFGKLMTEQHP